MTKQDKNIRTLIVCFVLLILGLIPLRFVEVKNMKTSYDLNSQVLGEETVVEVEEVDNVDIILPSAEIDLRDITN